MSDPDADIRLEAFRALRAAIHLHGGALPWAAIKIGFRARGQPFLFASAAEGIFRPAGMSGLLSIKTVVPKPSGRIWYHDQTAAPDVSPSGDLLWYAFRGSDPEASRNLWLKDAMERQLPLIYFYGVAPGVYEPLFPAFIAEWHPERLSCGLSFADPAVLHQTSVMPPPPERRYTLRTVRHRLHQAMFRERVLDAYGRRCALSGLPEPRLIDAAHIVPDYDDDLGQPDVRNGICMSKIHHAAYDAGLIGIDPDYRIHVQGRLLAMHDGPMLEQGLKAMAGRLITIPLDTRALPDRDRLAVRFDRYLAAN
ncbi:MAG: HNH endonuclease [Pannonibacter sp.]